MVAPSTATAGTAGLAEAGVEPGVTLPAGSGGDLRNRRRVGGAALATVGLGRQDELLRHADLVVCGGGYGMLSKTLMAGCRWWWCWGGGDQWSWRIRLCRQGSGRLVAADLEALGIRGEVLSSPYREAAMRATEHLEVADPGTGVP